MKLNTVPEIIDDIRAGKMVILMDDEDRENEGDLVMASTHVRPDDINFMITHARGLVCVTLTEERCQRLDLTPMSSDNGTKFSTGFTQSIEAKEGVTTGISPADRALTIQTAVSATAKATDIVKPGHVFPIMARNGGVLHRAGHTEAGCDLTRLAGLEPSAVICEITNADGTMARRDDLEVFAQEHDLKIGTIADLIHYRITHEQTVQEISVQNISTDFGDFRLHRFSEYGTDETHVALVKGDLSQGISTVRVHGFQPLRDLFAIKKQESGRHAWNVQSSLAEISKQDNGVLVWIADDTSTDLGQALDSLNSNKPINPEQAPQPYRSTGVGAQILRHLGVKDMRLLSSPMKFQALSGFDLNVVEFVSSPE